MFKKIRVNNSLFKIVISILIALSSIIIFSSVLFSVEGESKEETAPNKQKEGAEDDEEKKKEKEGNILLDIPADIFQYLIDRPEEIYKYLEKREFYKQQDKKHKKDIITTPYEADVSAISQSASESLHNIIVFVCEIPSDRENVIYAPIFMADRKKIFGTATDFTLKWVGYKATLAFKQDKFPWGSASLTETVIGSFLYASGTNTGFNRGKFEEERRFYTNYFSEIVTLKQKYPAHTYAAFSLDSRQYFFVERTTPPGFIMPKNHFNIFPRIDLCFDYLKETGIDQLTEGLKILGWAGYGVRNRWEEWGEPGYMQPGEEVRKFIIYSLELTGGLLFKNNQNLILRAHYKGGYRNDFLSKPRFGGTIDNAKLDVVHGTTLDQFRIKEFGLINLQYGIDIIKRLRGNLFFDYAHIFSPYRQDVFGSGYGIRILAWGGLPIWLTHGISKSYYPDKKSVEQVFMIMTAAGW